MGRWDDEDKGYKHPGEGRSKYSAARDREERYDSVSREADTNKRRERSRSPASGKGCQKARDETINDTKASEAAAAVSAADTKPDFGLSGLLAAETNTTAHGVVLKHQEPPEKGFPAKKWRVYVFKDGKPLEQPLKIHDQSNYLFGRDRRVVDIATDHGSCSLQHAVIQYRTTDKDGHIAVRPYLMDLRSTNGTFLNGDRLDPERYYELLSKDVITFGESTREYIVLKE